MAIIATSATVLHTWDYTHQLCSLYLQLALMFMVIPEALISIPEGLATRDDVGMASPLSLMLH